MYDLEKYTEQPKDKTHNGPVGLGLVIPLGGKYLHLACQILGYVGGYRLFFVLPAFCQAFAAFFAINF